MDKQFASEHSQIDIAYLAGIIDGEGCITVVEYKPRPGQESLRLIISNTSEELLDWIVSKFGGNVRPRKKLPNNKQAYVWILVGQKAKNMIKEALPYLVVKHRQGTIALEFPILKQGAIGTEQQYDARRFILYELQRLNKE